MILGVIIIASIGAVCRLFVWLFPIICVALIVLAVTAYCLFNWLFPHGRSHPAHFSHDPGKDQDDDTDFSKLGGGMLP